MLVRSNISPFGNVIVYIFWDFCVSFASFRETNRIQYTFEKPEMK